MSSARPTTWTRRESVSVSAQPRAVVAGTVASGGRRPLRVLFNYGLPGRGGDAVQVLALAEAFRDAGHAVALFGLGPVAPYDFASAQGRIRTWLRRRPWWARDLVELGLGIRALPPLRSLLRGRAFDLVFHRATMYDPLGLWQAGEFPLPMVVHLDAPWGDERAFRGEGGFMALHRRSMARLGRIARLIVTVSEASRDYYVRIGVPARKMLVLPNAVPARLAARGAILSREHPPFARPGACTIGFAGSLSRWHRVDLLLESCRRLVARDGDGVGLVIVGCGEEYDRIRTAAGRSGLEGSVRWLGPMSHDRAFEEMARFDIAVLPHTLATGAPMKLLEYAALGRPMIVPDLPNLRALFADGEAVFVPPLDPEALAEAIRTLRRDPARAREIGRRAAARVREQTWERWVAGVIRAVH
jgi:glycosyltransferase involved in cell wall biosynthesis